MSRPRSQPASNRAARGRTPARGGAPGGAAAARRVSVPKAQSDVYTAMLAISLASILIGCALLAWHWSQYNFEIK